MKKGLLVTLGIGIGWMVGISLMGVLIPLNSGGEESIGEILGNLLFFGFPGFIMFMIALILAARDDVDEELFGGKF